MASDERGRLSKRLDKIKADLDKLPAWEKKLINKR